MTDEKRIILATTFSREEINALIELMAALDRSGDVSAVLKNEAITSLRRKFLKLRAKGEK